MILFTSSSFSWVRKCEVPGTMASSAFGSAAFGSAAHGLCFARFRHGPDCQAAVCRHDGEAK
jgi:hypothetical protein